MLGRSWTRHSKLSVNCGETERAIGEKHGVKEMGKNGRCEGEGILLLAMKLFYTCCDRNATAS